MPARKSNASGASNEDAPVAKSAPKDDGLGVEVRSALPTPRSILIVSGPQFAQINSSATRQRRITAQYTNPEGCAPRNVKKRNGIRQLHYIMVRNYLRSLDPHLVPSFIRHLYIAYINVSSPKLQCGRTCPAQWQEDGYAQRRI